eukprot:4183290-Amphidinium_carterae.1
MTMRHPNGRQCRTTETDKLNSCATAELLDPRGQSTTQEEDPPQIQTRYARWTLAQRALCGSTGQQYASLGAMQSDGTAL